MTARELLHEIRDRGGRLEVRGDRLHVEAPAGTLTPELRASLVQRKPELIDVLTRNGPDQNNYDWAQMSLAEMERRHVAIQIRSDDFGMLWLVSTEKERSLVDYREPAYTVEEARRMIELPEALVRQIHELKRTFGVTVEQIQRGGLSENV